MSNIEEDIKILENLKKYLNLLIYEGTHKIIYNDLGWDEKTIDCINAIDHILEEREEDKKRIKELEEKLLDMVEGTKYIKKETSKETAEYIKENYIPKQKVINSINYYDQRIKHAKLIKDKEQEEFYIDIKRAFYKLLEDE